MSAFSAYPLYLAPANVWVEDDLTKEYLDECWQDPQIGFRVAGRADVVFGAVRDARAQGLTYVFGVQDSDFGGSNYADWPDLSKVQNGLFRLPVHEVENYLLDDNSLAACAYVQRGATDIGTRILKHARECAACVACQRVMRKHRSQITNGYPEDPDIDKVRDLAAAASYTTSSPWFSSLDQTAQ